ncbi:MAG: GTPase domain-containing protein [Gammaproteobacteria bacterium]|nr:GTPase domain-containing protein [Gammaproteobacteria bacterium]
MEYDEDKQRLTVKLVYYGPALSGKTTNLMRLHDFIVPERRGEIMTLETKNDRTLFFDLLPLGFTAPSGLLVKFKLFTVPGQVAHDGTRKAVLSRTDGVVFVADSQRSQGINNGASFENLAENAGRVGLDFERLPLVVQFNKRDVAEIYSEAELRERWSATPWPLTFASALVGTGVLETFRLLLQRAYPVLDSACALGARHGVSVETFVGVAGTDSLEQALSR